jgi:hypothetical protein
MSKSGVIVLGQTMVKSRVWLSLSGTAIQVYLLFRCKCQIAKKSSRPGKRSEGLIERILNNGEIEFTYLEAKDRYGFTFPRFSRAIGELVEKGFLDIAEPGGGVHKLKTLYGISERWKDYGTTNFKKVERPKRSIAIGFRRGNKLWQQAQKKKSTDAGVSGTTDARVSGEVLAMHTDVSGRKIVNSYNYCDGRYLCTHIA